MKHTINFLLNCLEDVPIEKFNFNKENEIAYEHFLIKREWQMGEYIDSVYNIYIIYPREFHYIPLNFFQKRRVRKIFKKVEKLYEEKRKEKLKRIIELSMFFKPPKEELK